MKFFSKAKDGGPDSPVTGYFLVEIKPLFSIVLLKFEPGLREAFHNHAFHAVTLWLKGTVKEFLENGSTHLWGAGQLKFTPRSCSHRLEAKQSAWALSIRGPWLNTWREFFPITNKQVILTHGRKVVAEIESL